MDAVQVWLKTGDKLETAVSIARSSQLVGSRRTCTFYTGLFVCLCM